MTVISAAPCVIVGDFMVLYINPQALANAGADAVICEKGTYTLSGATSEYTALQISSIYFLSHQFKTHADYFLIGFG